MAYDEDSYAERGGFIGHIPVTILWMDDDEFDEVYEKLRNDVDLHETTISSKKWFVICHDEQFQSVYDKYAIIGGDIVFRRERKSTAGEKGRQASSEYAPRPIAIHDGCLLICEDVLRSYSRPRHAIDGVIDNITVSDTPAQIGPYIAYIRAGRNVSVEKIVLRLSSTATDEEILEFEAKLPNQDPLVPTRTLVVKIPVFEVSTAGVYLFQALHGGEAFAEALIRVVQTDEPEIT